MSAQNIKYTTDGKKVVVIGNLNSQEKIVQEVFIINDAEIPSGENFVVTSFASQIANLEKSGGGELKVGNLNAWRDFTDVRDMVKAYLLALDKCIPGEVYNIGSSKPVKIQKK